jgi:hypothetical protein
MENMSFTPDALQNHHTIEFYRLTKSESIEMEALPSNKKEGEIPLPFSGVRKADDERLAYPTFLPLTRNGAVSDSDSIPALNSA